jgi:hypothetical protein
VGQSSDISSYGICATGMSGPEVLYSLTISSPLRFLELSLGADADLRLFMFSGNDPDNCLAMARRGLSTSLANVSPGAYYLSVDGPAAGTYSFAVHCFGYASDSTGVVTGSR